MRSQFMSLLLIFAGIGHAVYQRRKVEAKESKRMDTPAGRYVETQSAEREQAGT